MLNLKKSRERRADDEVGFTLVELLVVVVIIGILIAIAIPVYMNYKRGAADKSAMSDLRAAAGALEQCQADNGGYPLRVPATSGTLCDTQSITTSDGTVLSYYSSSDALDSRVDRASSKPSSYLLLAWNTKGSTTADTPFCYASTTGGSIKRLSTAPSTYAASC